MKVKYENLYKKLLISNLFHNLKVNQYQFLEENNNIDILGSWAIEFDEDIQNPKNFIKKVPNQYSDIIKF